jgi:hypothetical protein
LRAVNLECKFPSVSPMMKSNKQQSSNQRIQTVIPEEDEE